MSAVQQFRDAGDGAEQIGQSSLSGSLAARLVEPSQIAHEVRSIRVHADSQRQESPGLESLTEPLGQTGHKGRVASGLVPLVEALVAIAKPQDLSESGTSFGRARGTPGQGFELDQAVEDGQVGGGLGDQPLQRRSLSCDVPAANRQPGHNLMNPCRIRETSGNMLDGL